MNGESGFLGFFAGWSLLQNQQFTVVFEDGKISDFRWLKVEFLKIFVKIRVVRVRTMIVWNKSGGKKAVSRRTEGAGICVESGESDDSGRTEESVKSDFCPAVSGEISKESSCARVSPSIF